MYYQSSEDPTPLRYARRSSLVDRCCGKFLYEIVATEESKQAVLDDQIQQLQQVVSQVERRQLEFERERERIIAIL